MIAFKDNWIFWIFWPEKCRWTTFWQGGQHFRVARPAGGRLFWRVWNTVLVIGMMLKPPKNRTPWNVSLNNSVTQWGSETKSHQMFHTSRHFYDLIFSQICSENICYWEEVVTINVLQGATEFHFLTVDWGTTFWPRGQGCQKYVYINFEKWPLVAEFKLKILKKQTQQQIQSFDVDFVHSWILSS